MASMVTVAFLRFSISRSFGPAFGRIVALVFGTYLPEDSMVLMHPGTDQMNCRLAAGLVETTADGLAINRDQLAFAGTDQIGDPGFETSLESLWVQSGKDALEGVVGGYSIGQFEEGPQPRFLSPAKVSDIHPRFSPTNHGTDGNCENVLFYVTLCDLPVDRIDF